MNSTKKLMSILVALLMVATLLAGCGKNAAEPQIVNPQAPLGRAAGTDSKTDELWTQYRIVDAENSATKTLLDLTEEKRGIVKQIDVRIVSGEIDASVTDEAIKEAYFRAMGAYDDEMAVDSSGNQIGTYNYYIVGENESYFYEQTAESPLRTELVVIIPSDTEKASLQSEASVRPTDPTRGSDGYYGRMYINNTTNQFSSASIALPKSSDISISNGQLYIYGGFAGGPGADMGVHYSIAHDNWKAAMQYDYPTMIGNYLTGYNAATNLNGYLPNKTIIIYCHPYNDQSNGITGSIRLKVEGLAQFADMYGNGGNTNLTTIMESHKAYNLSSVTYHKWLATLAGSTSVGHNIGKFTNIKINGTLQSSTLFNTATSDGVVTFSDKGNGSITIDVKDK